MSMARFNFKSEGDEVREEKFGKFQFGFHKLRNVLGGGSINHDMHTIHQDTDHFNRQGPHTYNGQKQNLSKTHSYNPLSAGQDAFFTRNKSFLASSAPARDEKCPVSHKVCG